MSQTRAALLLTHIYFHKCAYTAPNPAYESSIPSEKRGALFMPTIIVFFTNSYTFICILEALVILASNYPDRPISQHLLSATTYPGPTCAMNIQTSILFLLGTFIYIPSDLLRLWCFHELGKHFTFTLTIQKDHKLITTGPYAYLRHPSYLGTVVGTIAEFLCLLSRGSWYMECTGPGMSGGPVLVMLKGLLCARLVARFLGGIHALRRPLKEDPKLREKFGREWDDWAKRVPYREIPGIY